MTTVSDSESTKYEVKWDAVTAAEFIFEDRCWETCGGYCCASRHSDFCFQLIPMGMATVLYFADEYRYLSRAGKVLGMEGPGHRAQRLSLDFGGPKPLSLIQAPCPYLGECAGKINKPLHCKLYPFMPVFALDGTLKDLYPFSVFDLTMLVRGEQSPCTIWGKKDAYLKKWREDSTALDVLRHPFFIFHSMVGKTFADLYTEKLRADKSLAGLEGVDFWRKWEFRYLAGRLMDGDALRSRAAEAHEKVVDAYGPFWTE